MTLRVEQPGLLTLVQDPGRPGLGHLGVSAAGAFDRGALRQANALLGNDPDAAAIELLGGGLVLRAAAPHRVAVTGAPGPVTIDGRHVAHGRALRLAAGQLLRVDPPSSGLRTYVGVAGGLDAQPELGSVSTDTLAGLGPAPLVAGDTLHTGREPVPPLLEDVLPLVNSGDITVDVVLGPRDDWFSPVAVRRLLDDPWHVSPSSDRVGVRLVGEPLERSRTDELPSEPCLRGSVQVAADGQPIVFGPDHPVTGGYPVIAVVVDAHTDRLAQARPGQVVRFHRVP
ncbi:biotin-dependent carboxyltransferase family protein [Aeromicrobium chenweiae]|uniref:Allophanate hydrolase n=1 Tax=Aeromicrobium chenweiae TaxID=2079793 RepID=A0A2S0WPS1_9ACTN|nr:biotin-dependent carboxyltransferase family protein [Aeromicrobium chenweiae]AWB93338.1 allophanate hydrolase [Aeromicrobium chenweiae]TGN34328.1 biotin-dependent carboxyltransferase [Aeromicrobium chenweiae]